MDSTTTAALSVDKTSNLQATLWQRIAAYLIRRRVRISLIVFVLLIAEDFAVGVRPHDIADLHDWSSVVGLSLVLAGVSLRTWAAGILHKNKRLSQSGPYEIIRHPLYVGSFVMMIGFCVLIDDWENIWIILGPVLGFYTFSVLREERSLRDRFGQQWHEYAQAVPRFLPRRLPRNPIVNWRRSQWMANREFRLAGASLLGLIGLQVWRLLKS